MTMSRPVCCLLSFIGIASCVRAFGGMTMPSQRIVRSGEAGATSLVVTFMGGFGASSDSKKQKKETKLKPKAQWDRYLNLKGETMIRVGVRRLGDATADDEDNNEWLEIGRVRSKGSTLTEVAVARQRALIAEHARRLFPLKVSSKDTLEWAYCDEDSDNWIFVNHKNVSMEKGVEKQIGFEGRPDPSSGFYCQYNQGRLVDSEKPK